MLSSLSGRGIQSARLAAILSILASVPAPAPAGTDDPAADLVAVGLSLGGRRIVLATPGLRHAGRLWRFRVLDTSELPQPLDNVVLAATGTKLFLQPHDGPAQILDLTWQERSRGESQYVDPRDSAVDGGGRRQRHRLPFQRFVSIRNGEARVVDDSGAVRAEYPAVAATRGAISDDGTVLYVRGDGSVLLCGEAPLRRDECRDLPPRVGDDLIDISARSTPDSEARAGNRFLILARAAQGARIVNPDGGAAGPILGRAEASLRACVDLHHLPLSDSRIASLVSALESESAGIGGPGAGSAVLWRFFRVVADEQLYAPVLELARRETVFPSAFETLAELTRAHPDARTVPALYERYLRLDGETRRNACTIYIRTHSALSAWLIEYWFYYPFDVGGLDSHLHDPEHLFVEVDKLGGRVRRVIGAGHGYLAGNNVYTADRAGAFPADLPLFAIVELGKHATAPDVDRNGVFTPGLDENQFGERAKIWGVRDVIGTINNQLLAYDSTMTVPRRAEDYVAPAAATQRFPELAGVISHASCRLQPMPDSRTGSSPCDEPTTDCARRYVTTHPDFRDEVTILKDWVFPRSFLRVGYVLGPRRGLHSIGAGYSMDLDAIPGLRFVPLPGRLGGEVFVWHQDVKDLDQDSCLAHCDHPIGGGYGVRYEQFLSNLFGIFSGVRVYSPPVSDLWVTFGPFVEVPLFNRSNVNLEGGLSFRPAASPRFELRLSIGLWKPRTARVGMRAAITPRLEASTPRH